MENPRTLKTRFLSDKKVRVLLYDHEKLIATVTYEGPKDDCIELYYLINRVWTKNLDTISELKKKLKKLKLDVKYRVKKVKK